MVSDEVPQPEELLPDLRQFVRVGARPARLPELSRLAGLAIVGVAAHGTRAVDRALSLIIVLEEAATALGEGPSGEAVRLLLGLVPRSRGLLLKDRRDLAAEALGIDVATWRRHWEKPLLLELATELYRMESEQRIPVRVKPKRGATAVLDDLRQGTGGKSLDRREAEARLFSLMYALRADLLAVARLTSAQPKGEGHRQYVETALWRFATFLHAMARFADEFGSAIVMAGNEVTVREAVALLGWRPPLDDEQAGYLRTIVAAAPDDSLAAFLDHLTQDERGQTLLAEWRAWLEE